MRTLTLLFLSGLFTTHLRAQESHRRHSPPDTDINEVRGDFDGDGHLDRAIVVLVKKGEGNPAENGSPGEYEIRFPGSKTLKPIKAGCCAVRLVNEGDLDHKGADALSLFQAPMNGCTYSMKTYAFTQGAWKVIVPLFLVPTGCDPISDPALQQRIFLEKGNIYYLETDVNDENGRLVRKKVGR